MPSSNTGAEKQHILNFNIDLKAVSCSSRLYLWRKKELKWIGDRVDPTVHLYTLVKKTIFAPAGI
jgi:hypothetical protein